MFVDMHLGPIADWRDAVREIRSAIKAAAYNLGIRVAVDKHVTITNAAWTPPGYDADYSYWENLGRIEGKVYFHPTKSITEEDWLKIADFVKNKYFRRGHDVFKGDYESIKLRFIKSKYPINHPSRKN